MPEPRLGEVLMAVCALSSGTTPEEWEPRAIEMARAKLANYKVPRSYSYVSELPKSAAGKILKRLVREQYWKDQEGSIG